MVKTQSGDYLELNHSARTINSRISLANLSNYITLENSSNIDLNAFPNFPITAENKVNLRLKKPNNFTINSQYKGKNKILNIKSQTFNEEELTKPELLNVFRVIGQIIKIDFYYTEDNELNFLTYSCTFSIVDLNRNNEPYIVTALHPFQSKESFNRDFMVFNFSEKCILTYVKSVLEELLEIS